MRKKSYLTVTDQFCGAGGSSQGFMQAAAKMGISSGVGVQWALNHWKLAIETHNTNFPDTNHDCTDIQACDPRRYDSTDILITSPECTNHSLAKGKKRKFNPGDIVDPKEERSRATMWDVPRFAEYHKYNIVIVENVVDARYWVQWPAWIQAMDLLGYNHECVYLNSMFCHPTPQSRDRMYVVFWKKGNKKPDLDIRPLAPSPTIGKDVHAYQSWKNPEKTWGKYKQQYVYRCPETHEIVTPYYHAAFNCIDWSIPGTRIGDRKRPLRPKTMAKIEHGRDKYWDHPLVIATRYSTGLDGRVKPAFEAPIGTQPGDVSHAVLSYSLDFAYGGRVKGLEDPLVTQAAREHMSVVYAPFFTTTEHGNAKLVRNSLDPARTQTTTDSVGFVHAPYITVHHGTSKSRSINDPLNAVTAGGIHSGLIHQENMNAFLGYYYGNSYSSSLGDPIGSATTKARHYMAVMPTSETKPAIEDLHFRMIKAHEVKRAMAFAKDYIVLGCGRDQIKQLGNAVTPPAMEVLTERCVQTLM